MPPHSCSAFGYNARLSADPKDYGVCLDCSGTNPTLMIFGIVTIFIFALAGLLYYAYRVAKAEEKELRGWVATMTIFFNFLVGLSWLIGTLVVEIAAPVVPKIFGFARLLFLDIGGARPECLLPPGQSYLPWLTAGLAVGVPISLVVGLLVMARHADKVAAVAERVAAAVEDVPARYADDSLREKGCFSRKKANLVKSLRHPPSQGDWQRYAVTIFAFFFRAEIGVGIAFVALASPVFKTFGAILIVFEGIGALILLQLYREFRDKQRSRLQADARESRKITIDAKQDKQDKQDKHTLQYLTSRYVQPDDDDRKANDRSYWEFVEWSKAILKAIITTALRTYPLGQAAGGITIEVLYFVVLCWQQPYERFRQNLAEISNESLFLLCLIVSTIAASGMHIGAREMTTNVTMTNGTSQPQVVESMPPADLAVEVVLVVLLMLPMVYSLVLLIIDVQEHRKEKQDEREAAERAEKEAAEKDRVAKERAEKEEAERRAEEAMVLVRAAAYTQEKERERAQSHQPWEALRKPVDRNAGSTNERERSESHRSREVASKPVDIIPSRPSLVRKMSRGRASRPSTAAGPQQSSAPPTDKPRGSLVHAPPPQPPPPPPPSAQNNQRKSLPHAPLPAPPPPVDKQTSWRRPHQPAPPTDTPRQSLPPTPPSVRNNQHPEMMKHGMERDQEALLDVLKPSRRAEVEEANRQEAIKEEEARLHVTRGAELTKFVAGNGHVSKLKRGLLRQDTRHKYFFCVKDSELVWKGKGYRVVNAQMSAEIEITEGDLEPSDDRDRCLRVTLEGRGGEGRQDDVVLMAFNEDDTRKWVMGLQAIAGGRP